MSDFAKSMAHYSYFTVILFIVEKFQSGRHYKHLPGSPSYSCVFTSKQIADLASETMHRAQKFKNQLVFADKV